MKKEVGLFIGIGLFCVLAVFPSHSGAETFYEGKTIHIIVGYSPGGGLDLNARAIARQMGKYIPGKPTVIVENMIGAGGLVLANTLYKASKPDGLTIGHVVGNLIFSEICGEPGIQFNGRKFGYIGAAMRENGVCVLSKASGINSIDKWVASRTPMKLGSSGKGTFIENMERIIKAALELPIQIISGYKGTPEMRLAVESGEITGCAFGWDAMKATWHQSLKAGTIIPILQAVPKPLPDLPNVPLAIQYAKTKEAKRLIEIGLHGSAVFSRPYLLPPGVPEDRVQILRTAFEATMKDKDYLAEMEKMNMGPDPVSGEEVEKNINEVYLLDTAFLTRLKQVLFGSI